jgi:hypothetical protein
MALELMFKPSGGGSGGGGGSSIEWIELADAPIYSIDDNIGGFDFEATLTQYLYAKVKLASSYTGGQVSIKSLFYSPGNSGNILLQTLATLNRTAVDAVTSTTNQRTSTNAAVALGAGTVNENQAVTFDITDSSGQINSVAAAAGDTIFVRLTRGTDTATAKARFMFDECEVVYG